MPKIEHETLPWEDSSSYPEPLASHLAGRYAKRLADAGGLSQLEVNLARLAPGAQSTMRHWHEVEDEFVFVLDGDLILVEATGETNLSPGEAASFPGGVPNAHHLVNRSDAPAFYLEISYRSDEDRVTYPDDGLKSIRRKGIFSFE